MMFSIAAALLLYVSPQHVDFLIIGGQFGKPLICETIHVSIDEEIVLTTTDIANIMKEKHPNCDYFDIFLFQKNKYTPVAKWRKQPDNIWKTKDKQSNRWYTMVPK